MSRTRSLTALAALGALALAGCSVGGESATPSEIRIGYFPNFTHAPALVGLSEGYYHDELGEVEVEPLVFNAGPAAIEALFAGSVDIAFIGPNPTITGYSQSDGEALRVIAGSAANGASLVVREGIDTPADLAGTRIATPQLGNTQDIALRHWLSEQGYATDTEGGGDVSVLPQENGTTLTTLLSGEIDGAWVPEPWATRLVLEADAHVLVDEKDLWEGGRFVVTNVIVRTEFLERHPEQVEAFLRGLLRSLEEIETDPERAKATVNDSIEELTGSALSPEVLDAAWENVIFTADPIATTLVGGAEHAVAVGLLDEVSLDGLYALDLLNGLLVEQGLDPVSGP